MADILDDVRDRLLRMAGQPLQAQHVDRLVAEVRSVWGGDRLDYVRKSMAPRATEQRQAIVSDCLQRGMTPWQITSETGIARATVYRLMGKRRP